MIRSITIVFSILFFAFYSEDYYSNQNHIPEIIFEKDEFREAGEIALTYFPELKNKNIHFIDAGKSKIAHQAIPKKNSLFRSRNKRTYFVKIANDQFGELDSTLFKHLSLDAQIGVLGHELAHIVDYTDDSVWQLIGKGRKYSARKTFREELEKETNMLVVNHGLGRELLSWTKEVHQYLEADGRGYLYHSPEELEPIVNKYFLEQQ